MDNAVKLRVMLAYKNNVPIFDTESFMEDYMRFTYILKQLTLYNANGKINIRLLLNHFIVVYNVFDTSATEILFDKAQDNLLPQVCAFLRHISRMPVDDFTTISGKIIKPNTLTYDEDLYVQIQEEIA